MDILNLCVLILSVSLTNAHPEWLQLPGLQQLISTPAPPIQVPQQLSQSHSPSYNSGYLQAGQNIRHAPQQVAYAAPQYPVAKPLPPTLQSSNSPGPAYPQQSIQAPTPQYSYVNNQITQQTSSSDNFWFKEGTPILPCGYGAGSNGLPLPQYNNPHKKCVPWHPMCGWMFSCIVDV